MTPPRTPPVLTVAGPQACLRCEDAVWAMNRTQDKRFTLHGTTTKMMRVPSREVCRMAEAS